MTVQSYQEFQVWNVAMDLATECYRISQMLSRPTKAKRAWSVRRGAWTWRNDDRAKLSGIRGVECGIGLGYRVLPDQPDALTPHESEKGLEREAWGVGRGALTWSNDDRAKLS